MMIIDMQRFCIILLALWASSSRVRGQSYDDETTEAPGTTGTEEGTTGDTTVFPDYTH